MVKVGFVLRVGSGSESLRLEGFGYPLNFEQTRFGTLVNIILSSLMQPVFIPLLRFYL